MKNAFIRLGIIFFTFIIAFYATTALFDTLEHHMGYYDQGIAKSNEVGD
jgi:hypothetical protein